jgi:c-di-GMP-binding flagellar brake protein YcgR
MLEPLPLENGRKIIAHIRGESYDVCVRGWAEHQFILIDMPRVSGELVRVAPQTGCTVNFIRDGKMVSFKSSVIFCFNQALVMLIEFPKRYDMFNLRKSIRFRTNFQMNYSYKVLDTTIVERATIRDTSMGGFLITHGKPLTKKSIVSIETTLPSGTIEGVTARVCSVRKNPKEVSEPFVTGLQLIEPGSAVIHVMKVFLDTRLRSERREKARISF